jgi:ribonucleoside-diphosphate reductase alpha chain
MLKHGEPGFTVDRGDKRDEVLRNACTEITSADDSDVCNLGSLVLSRFDDPQQFGAAVRDAVLFLTAGTLYSDVPYAKVREVATRTAGSASA